MKKIFSFLSICLCIVFVGCSKSQTTNTLSELHPLAPFGTNWQKTGFCIENSINASYIEALMNSPYQTLDWQEFSVTKPDFSYTYRDIVSCCNEDTLFMLYTFERTDGNRFFFQSYDILNQALHEKEVLLPQEIGSGYVLGMDVWNSIIYLFLKENGNLTETKNSGLWILSMDIDGTLLNTFALEADANKQETLSMVYDFYVDAEGYCYLFAENSLYIYDKNGEFVFSKEDLVEEGSKKCSAFHTPDGSVVVQRSGSAPETAELQWYDIKQKKAVELVKMDDIYIPCMTMTMEGMVYMLKTSQLVKWNVVTGKQEPLYNFVRSSINPDNIRQICVTTDGDVHLFQLVADKWNIYTLSDREETQNADAIILTNLCVSNSFIEAQTPTFSRKNPAMEVFIEKSSGDQESYRNRIMAQLAAGRGPDLMWVTREDMEILQKKGALMDLCQVISEETLAQIFPGVLADGIIDDTLYGLYFDGTPCTYLVSNNIWPDESWNVEDIYDILDRENNLRDITPSSKSSVLSNFFLENLGGVPFIDLDAKESYFNSREFIRLLEYVNEYNTNMAHSASSSGSMDMVTDEKLLTFPLNIEISDLSLYSSLMDKYGQACHFVGILNDEKYLGYWAGENFLVVNAKSQKKEEIGKYYEYLLSAEAQRNTLHCSIRGDVIQRNVYWEMINEQNYACFLKRNGTMSYLDLQEDGTTYLEEYISFLNKCGPNPKPYKEIKEIIVSGAEGYFNGQYTAERAAELIHNRVQLYLDEQK